MRRTLPPLTSERAEQLFKKLNVDSQRQNQSGGRLTSTCAAILPLNRPLNRWHNVLPADGTRVKLNPMFEGTDYINANHVIVPEAFRAFILTQGPLPETLGHFWNMVWQQKSEAIVMLCKTVEGNACKCAHYWPRNSSPIMGTSAEPIMIPAANGGGGGLEIRLLETTEEADSDARIRVMELTCEDRRRIVTQYHFQTWPDFGVPATPDTFLSFLRLVSRRHPSTHDKPNVVHCSAGIGRSGTFCLVDSCLQIMARSGRPMNQDEILKHLLKMRRQRDGQVQTPDQLKFAFAAISDGMSAIEFTAGLPKSPNMAVMPAAAAESEDTPPPATAVDSNSTSRSASPAAADDEHDQNGRQAVDAQNGEVVKPAAAASLTNGNSVVEVVPLPPTAVVGQQSRKRSTDAVSGSLGEEAAARVAAAAAAADAAADDEDKTAAVKMTSSGENLAKKRRDC